MHYFNSFQSEMKTVMCGLKWSQGFKQSLLDCFTYFTIFPIYPKWCIIRYCCVPIEIEINCIWSETFKKTSVTTLVLFPRTIIFSKKAENLSYSQIHYSQWGPRIMWSSWLSLMCRSHSLGFGAVILGWTICFLLEVNGKTLFLMNPVKCQTIIKTMHAVSYCIFCFCYGEMLSSGCLILWCLFVVDVPFRSATREIVLTVLSYSSIVLVIARATETSTSFSVYWLQVSKTKEVELT